MSYSSTSHDRRRGLTRRHATRFALAALAATTAATAASAPAQAAGRTHCDFDPVTGISMIQPAPDANGVVTELFLDQGRVMFRDAVGNDFCYGPHGEIAGFTNATSILFVGTPGKDDFIISQLGGRFGGGAPGGSDPTQIETTVLSDSQDIVDITGTDQADSIGITGGNGTGKQGGILTFFGGSGKPTVKLTTPPSVVRVNGLNGTDNISGRGMFGTPTSMHLQLAGGFGNDYLEGGLLAGDRLQGDDGDDGFFTRNGQPGDIVSGGLGVDHATVDVSDQASGIEKFNQAIGTLKLAHKTVTVDRGEATVELSWTHPSAWKKLKRIALVAYDGEKAVGSVTMSPKTGKLIARGGLTLAGDAKLSHKGKTVSARLPLKLRSAMPADGLRLAVTANDVTGNEQVEPGAGRLVAASDD